MGVTTWFRAFRRSLAASSAGGGYTDGPTEWADVDQMPHWIDLEDLPYRGGGVMGRRIVVTATEERDQLRALVEEAQYCVTCALNCPAHPWHGSDQARRWLMHAANPALRSNEEAERRRWLMDLIPQASSERSARRCVEGLVQEALERNREHLRILAEEDRSPRRYTHAVPKLQVEDEDACGGLAGPEDPAEPGHGPDGGPGR